MNIPVLDESKLTLIIDLDDGRVGLLEEMTALFKEEAPRRVEAIRGAIELNKASVAMEAAHALKGASGLMGAERVFSLAREIEKEAKGNRLPSLDVLRALNVAVAEAEQALDNFLSQFKA